jgi:glycosyltransferase involved in cell wall biosynthesis
MKGAKTDVLFLPDWRDHNPYLNLLAEGLSKNNLYISFGEFPRGYFKLFKAHRRALNARIVHLHWTGPLFREILISSSVFHKAWAFTLFVLDGLICRLMGVRFVWTIHNFYEHEFEETRAERLCRKVLFRLSRRAIVHSQGARKAVCEAYGLRRAEKLVVIPHGNYLTCPISLTPPNFGRESLGLSASTTVFLFFGMVRRYKGLEPFLAAFSTVRRADIALVVAGKSLDGKLSEWLNAEAEKDPRIIVRDEFVPDEDVSSYFDIADAVVLPFKKTLTSGSVILALGFGKPLILPSTAKLLDVPGEDGAWYYETEDELISLLENLSKATAREKGRVNRDIARSLSWQKIASETAKVYGKL